MLGGDNAVGQGVVGCQATAWNKPVDPGPSPAALTAGRRETDRLVALVHAPPGSREQTGDPSHGGPVWGYAASNRVEASRTWKLSMRFDQAHRWLLSYDPPAFARHGLHMENAPGSAGEARSPGHAVYDRSYYDRRPGHWSQAVLNIAVSRGADGSAYLDATGIVYPLDDHVRREINPCPGMRVLANHSCPDAEGHSHGFSLRLGVANPEQSELDRMLIPAEAPTGGLICYYGDGTAPLAQRTLDRSAAAAIANAARAVRLDHDDYQGPYGSLGGADLGVVVLALSYAGRPDVDLLSESHGGPGHVTNGHIQAELFPFGDSGFTCVLVRALPNPPQQASYLCPAG